MTTEDAVAPPETTALATVVPPEQKPSVEKPKKVKKSTVKGKPRSPSLHPPYFEMIKEAIVTLKERTGSSQYAITKFIEEKQKNLPANFKKVLLTQLKKLVAGGKLVKVKASYKLPAARAPAASAPAKKKAAVKPKTAAKPKSVKKVAPAKKKTVAKPKPAPKAKAAAKPKTAAKPKPAAKAKAVAKPGAKPKAASTKAKPKAKVAKTSTRATPGKKAPAAPKKATVKSLKAKPVIAKKAGVAKKGKK